jgi:protein SCO1/2
MREEKGMPRFPVVLLPFLLLATVLAAGALWRLGDLRAQRGTQTISIDKVELGGPFTLTDQNGEKRSDSEFRGKYMLIFFGYTFCPDVCPTTLAVMAAALDKMGSGADRIAPIFISVDPERDKPEVLKAYLSAFGPRFVGLTGTEEEIAATAKAYRVYVQSHKDEGQNYTVDHSGVVYLMDKSGAFLANYSLDASPDKLAADLTKQTIN